MADGYLGHQICRKGLPREGRELRVRPPVDEQDRKATLPLGAHASDDAVVVLRAGGERQQGRAGVGVGLGARHGGALVEQVGTRGGVREDSQRGRRGERCQSEEQREPRAQAERAPRPGQLSPTGHGASVADLGGVVAPLRAAGTVHTYAAAAMTWQAWAMLCSTGASESRSARIKLARTSSDSLTRIRRVP